MELRKNRPISPLKILALSLVGILLHSLLPGSALHATPQESFLLFYSCNLRGETEPCG